MNIPLLKQIREHILSAPKQFDMSSWVCGTACCIGGWAGMLSGVLKKRAVDANTAASLTRKGQSLAERVHALSPYVYAPDALLVNHETLFGKVLGLTYKQAERLFHTDLWPEPFQSAYSNTYDHAKQAKVAAKRINHFIRTKGEE